MRQRLVRNIGGTIYWFPPEARLLGPPDTGPTITITTAQGGAMPTPIVNAPATRDAFSQLTTSPSRAGVRSLLLASTTGLRLGGRYLLALSQGDYLVVRVFAVKGQTVFLFTALPCPVPAGTQLLGAELSYAIGAAQAQSPSQLDPTSLYYANPRPPVSLGPVDLTLFRAVWSYAIGGAAQPPGLDLFSINANLLRSTLDPEDLQPYLPSNVQHVIPPSDTAQFAHLMDVAWLEVLDDCENRGFKPDRIMDPARLRKAHLFKVLEVLGSTWGGNWEKWTEDKATKYGGAMSAALNAGDWYDSSDDGFQQAGEVRFSSIALTR